MVTTSDRLSRVAETADSNSNSILAFDRAVVARQFGCDGLLKGQFVAVKDNICTLEYPTTCGSRMLSGYRSPFEATSITRLKSEGAIIACKTNLDEFAMGSSTENSAFGRTLNPFDEKRVPGGSSGGSAAVVADGTVDYALGSETGGSVRQPAAFCGVVGIKPSYGRVSRHGLVSFASSLDQIGVFGSDVSRAEILLSVIAGHDARDATSVAVAPLELGKTLDSLVGVKIGLPVEYFPANLSPDVRAGCEKAKKMLQGVGAILIDVSLPSTHCAVGTYYVLAPAEASANLARFDGIRYGRSLDRTCADVSQMYRKTRGTLLGAEVKRRIIIGTYVLSSGYREAYYKRARVARDQITSEFDTLFANEVDLLFTPTVGSTAFESGKYFGDPLGLYFEDALVCPANLAGIPAMNLPLGRASGLPVGGQLIAPRFAESKMIAVARLLESMLDPLAEVR